MIIEIDEVDEFLEHFGVKGQKWGVRRAQSHKQEPIEKAMNQKIRVAGNAHRERKNRTPREKQLDRRKVAAGTAVGLGVFFIARGHLFSTPVAALAGVGASVGTQALIKTSRDKKISELGGVT